MQGGSSIPASPKKIDADCKVKGFGKVRNGHTKVGRALKQGRDVEGLSGIRVNDGGVAVSSNEAANLSKDWRVFADVLGGYGAVGIGNDHENLIVRIVSGVVDVVDDLVHDGAVCFGVVVKLEEELVPSPR